MLSFVSGMRLFDKTEATGIAQPLVKYNGQFNALEEVDLHVHLMRKGWRRRDEMEYICNNSHYMKTFAFTDPK